MSDRKQQILQSAIRIIAEQGYGALTMRALARANDLKLGALQYHYRTRDEMLRALVDYIAQHYRHFFEVQSSDNEVPALYHVVSIMLRNSSLDDTLYLDRLWPQLCAMKQVEPLMADLLDSLYEGYLQTLDTALEELGAEALHVEALGRPHHLARRRRRLSRRRAASSWLHGRCERRGDAAAGQLAERAGGRRARREHLGVLDRCR